MKQTMTSPLATRLAILAAFLNALVACCAPGGIIMLGCCADPVGHHEIAHSHGHHHHDDQCPAHAHDEGTGLEHQAPTPAHAHVCDDDQTITRVRHVESAPTALLLLCWVCAHDGDLSIRRVIAPAPRPPDLGGGRPPPWIATTILLI